MVSTQEISIETPDGPMMGYLAIPKSGSGPGIVVIQEIFGVNQNVRDICDTYAADGYVALAPDLFWRIEPGISITDQTEEEWAQAFDLFGKYDVPVGVQDVQSTINALRARAECTGKVGAVGFCLGGLLAYLTSARTDIDASVGYYGVGIQEMLDERKNISKPLMLHVPEEDEFIPKEAQDAILSGLADNPHATLHTYAGRDHAFTRIGGAHYNEKDARLAHGRTLDFFKTNL